MPLFSLCPPFLHLAQHGPESGATPSRVWTPILLLSTVWLRVTSPPFWTSSSRLQRSIVAQNYEGFVVPWSWLQTLVLAIFTLDQALIFSEPQFPHLEYGKAADRASLIALLVRICLQCRRFGFDSWVGKIHWRRDQLPTPVFLGFPCGSAGKESACNARNLGWIPGLRRSPGEGKDYRLQYSGLENPMDCVVHVVTKS